MDSALQIGGFVFLLVFILIITWLLSIKGNWSRSVITSLSFYIAVSISLLFFVANDGEELMNFWVVLGAMTLCIGIVIWAFEWKVERLRSVNISWRDCRKIDS